jgi:cysteine desulfuration protein SufE
MDERLSAAPMLPAKLQAVLETFDDFPDTADRTNLLLDYADAFKEVPPAIAKRPFTKDSLVPHCESEAYAWAVMQPDGTMAVYFAVENPAGISAKALATILQKTLSGLRAAVTPDIVERIFRQNISMGKGMGLMSMVEMIRTLAKRHLHKSSP